MTPEEARDELGRRLCFTQREGGTWSGTCPRCGALDAEVGTYGLVCVCSVLPLDEAWERYVAGNGRKLPMPMGVPQLLGLEEPKEEWLVEGLFLVASNVLFAAYPKSYKTMLLLELAAALTTGTLFLGRFHVPERRRVGLVLMEDQAYRVRRRLERIFEAHERRLEEATGWLHLWFRPPLRLNDETVSELAEYAAELNLDFLGIDSWSYVAAGDSNSADEVTPQLQALSAARLRRPGLTVELTHHARKEQEGRGKRLTDVIRNSGAFGAWYDSGVALSRRDEASPVTARVEHRDQPAPEPFAFTVEDEDPAGPHNDFRASGWLRLRVSDHRPETLERMVAAEKLVPAVRELLAKHPEGVSRTKLRSIPGANSDVEAAFELLVTAREAERIPSPGAGRPTTYRLLDNHPAGPCRDPVPAGYRKDPADPADTPVGGGRRQGSGVVERSLPSRQGFDDPTLEVLEGL